MTFYLNPKNWPIMIKISVALLCASMIPVFFIAYFNFFSSVATIEKSEYHSLELLATVTAERLDQLMQDYMIIASQLSSDGGIITFTKQANTANPPEALRNLVSPSLAHILASNPLIEYVYLLDKNGKVIISKQSDSTPTIEGQTFATQDYYVETIKGTPTIDVLVANTSGLGFYFSAPVLGDDGKPIGVAIINLNGKAVTDIVNKFKVGNTGYAFLIDQDGMVISHPNTNWYYNSLIPLTRETELKAGQRFMLSGCENPKQLDDCKVTSINLSSLASVIKESNSVRHATYILPSQNTAGAERIVGLANTRHLNWVVGVDEAKQEFTAPLNRLAQQTLLSVLGIGILAVIGGIILARVITQPLNKLSLAAQSVQRGETLQPEGFASVMQQGDEVGHLALVFNNMVQALYARVSELHTIDVVSRKISSSFNLGNTLTLVLNSLRSVVPYDRALVLLYDPINNEFHPRATSDGRGFYLNCIWNTNDHPVSHSMDENHIQQFFEKNERNSGAQKSDRNFSILIPDLSLTDAEMDYSFEWGDFEPKSYLGVPLLFKDKIIGIIELASAHSKSFTLEHARVLELIAGQAAVAVRNALDVEEREAELRKQIDELKIVIDEGNKQKYVNEIVESDFFQELTAKAKKIRQKHHGYTNLGISENK